MSERQTALAASAPATLFWAMHGPFSYAAMRSFLRGGGRVRAVFVPVRTSPRETDVPAWRPMRSIPHRPTSLPMLTSAVEPSVRSLAIEREIEVFEIANARDDAALALLDSLGAAAACVACWPWRIPGSVLERFPLGVVNLHPSLLPRHRGPAPLFWTLRHGDAYAGVTAHRMDETMDAGPILAQRQVDMVDGASGLALETLCADIGGEMLARCVRELAEGRLEPRAQEATSSTYEPWPRASDFSITTERSARWAYNFIHGAAYWGGPIVLDCADRRFIVREALGYALDASLDVPWRQDGAEVLVSCRPGVLRMRVGRR